MKKRFLAILLALVMVLAMAPPALAAEETSGTCGENLTWKLENSTLTISGTGPMADYERKPVGTINLRSTPWYEQRDKITSVVIYNGVTSIGACAFDSCVNMTSVTIPSSVTSIGKFAFAYCSGLTSVTIPNGITCIDYSVFRGCSGLTSVTIPNSVTSIEGYAFQNCISLTSVTIPNGVTGIEFGAFYGCLDLKDVYYGGTEAQWKAIQISTENRPLTSATIYCNSTGPDQTQHPITPTTPNHSDSDFTIENGVLKKYNGEGGTVIIPDGVTSIGASAFYGCTRLTRVIIPDSVTSIGNTAFRQCLQLTSVTIPDSVTSIGTSAFHSCAKLTSVTIGSGVTSIAGAMFLGCTSLTNIIIPEGITRIEDYAFSDCTKLTSVTIPSTVTKIDFGAFDLCSALRDVHYGGSEAQWKQLEINQGRTMDSPNGNIYLINATKHYNGTGTPTPTHTHAWSTAWSSDDSYHWHNCTAASPACDVTANSEKQGYGAHVYDNDRDAACNTCGYTRTVEQLPVSDDDHLTPGGTPVSSKNINAQEYVNGRRWAQTVNSYLYENSSGGLTRVECTDNQVVVEKYNDQFQLQASGTLPMELPIWGGFFAGENYNFLVFGQNNEEENNSKEVIRIVKYSKGWERLGAIGLYGANTIHPFRAGSVRFDEYNGYLYIRTCHEMYTSSDGQNHQANMMINVRQSDMKITDSFDKPEWAVGYVSHSMNQFILVNAQGDIVTLDHGDGYPRAATLQRYNMKAGQDKFLAGVAAADVCTFPGDIGANDTGAALGGLAETSNGYVTAYNFDGTASNLGTAPRDVYLAFTNKNFSNTTAVKLSSGGDTSVPVLVSTGLDGGYVMWNGRSGSSWYSATFDSTLHYARYDADGKAGAVQTATASLSDCAPVLWNGKVVWYVTDNSAPTFYTLDSSGVTAHIANSSSTTPAQPQTAKPTNDKLTVNGQEVTPTAYKIGGANYFKLRDVAMLLSGSPKQFNVGYDDATKTVTITTGQAYMSNGSELKGVPTENSTANASNNAILINGETTDLTVYKINGENYFQIRDLGKKLDFNVGWTSERGMFIEGDRSYDPSN